MSNQDNKHREIVFVLTNVKKFERKIYSFFGKSIGRSLSFVGILYFVLFAGVMFILRSLPVIQQIFLWIPFFVAYLAIPIGLAYLLTGVQTEGRKPILYFRSFFAYQIRQMRKKNYLYGRPVNKPQSYKMRGYSTYKDSRKTETVFPARSYKIKGTMTYNRN